MKNTKPTLPPIVALLHQARVATNKKDWDGLKRVTQKMQEYTDANNRDSLYMVAARLNDWPSDVPFHKWR